MKLATCVHSQHSGSVAFGWFVLTRIYFHLCRLTYKSNVFGCFQVFLWIVNLFIISEMSLYRVQEAKIVDVRESCYILKTSDGAEYQMPPNVGEYLEVRDGQLIQIGENDFLRLSVPDSDDEGESDNRENVYNIGDNHLENTDVNKSNNFTLTSNQSRNIFQVNSPIHQEDSSHSVLNNKSEELIWKSTRHVTDNDIKATTAFLHIRTSEKYMKLFADKKTKKSNVWQMLAEELKKSGFVVGNAKEGAERCRQKYHNLQKMYLQLIKASRKTGTGTKPLPKYFDLLEKLFSSQHNVIPTFVIDSVSGVSEPLMEHVTEKTNKDQASSSVVQHGTTDDSSNTTGTSSSRTSLSTCDTPTPVRFHTRPKKSTQSTSDKVVNTIVTLHKQMLEANEKHFQSVLNVLKEQNECKKEFLQIFKDMHNSRKTS